MKVYIHLLILLWSLLSSALAIDIYESTTTDYTLSTRTNNRVLDNGAAGIFSGYRSDIPLKSSQSLWRSYKWTIAREWEKLYFAYTGGWMPSERNIGDFKLLDMRCGIDKQWLYMMSNDVWSILTGIQLNYDHAKACGVDYCKYIYDNHNIYKIDEHVVIHTWSFASTEYTSTLFSTIKSTDTVQCNSGQFVILSNITDWEDEKNWLEFFIEKILSRFK